MKPILFACLAGMIGVASAAETRLSSLDLKGIEMDWGTPGIGKSVDGFPLRIGGRKFDDGLGLHAASVLALKLDGRARTFRAWVGVDDEVGKQGSVEFQVWTDDKLAWRSGTMHGGDAAKQVEVPLAGVKNLGLAIDSADQGIDCDHADWAEAVIEHDGAAPAVHVPEPERAVVLTPKPGPAPRLTGPRVFGARPGNPFLHRITATGDRPVVFAAEGLPPGVVLDSRTGMLTGALKEKGEWKVVVEARNAQGSARRALTIKGGDLIALTPPMGWNSWNCFAGAVSAEHIRDAAKAMVDSGLADHGWTYINIDDYWQVKPSAKNDESLQGPMRDAQGRISPNPRFPDMKGLADYVHGLGLKIGIYSSPGPWTCGGCVGSFDHEWLDAQSYAEWGFDYLKHDWCSYRPAMESKRTRKHPLSVDLSGMDKKLRDLMTPYAVMRAALDGQKRDIVYSLCQYGMGDVSQWGAQVGGNCWRTTGDIVDTWGSMAGIGFRQAGLAKYAAPGHWNDPDMLVVGKVGWGPSLHPTRLTPSEQYTHISLWCLLGAPLLIGCDMTQLDEFTLGLLTNDEVLDVNQDPLGKQAERIRKDGFFEVWAKKLDDGSTAVGLFNRGVMPAEVGVKMSELGISGGATVRDLWRQKDLGTAEGEWSARIPRHGCRLLKISPK